MAVALDACMCLTQQLLLLMNGRGKHVDIWHSLIVVLMLLDAKSLDKESDSSIIISRTANALVIPIHFPI